LIFNTKVFPARLYGNKEKTGARIEVFLLRELNAEQRLWDVLVDPARKIRGNKLYFGDDDSLVAEVMIIQLLVVEHYVSYTMVRMKKKKLTELRNPIPKYINRE
jgi:S-adenosylmethionine:tRNA ribosyltransferase-isomerase